MLGMAGINDSGYNRRNAKSRNVKVHDVACAADTATAQEESRGLFLTRCG